MSGTGSSKRSLDLSTIGDVSDKSSLRRGVEFNGDLSAGTEISRMSRGVGRTCLAACTLNKGRFRPGGATGSCASCFSMGLGCLVTEVRPSGLSEN